MLPPIGELFAAKEKTSLPPMEELFSSEKKTKKFVRATTVADVHSYVKALRSFMNNEKEQASLSVDDMKLIAGEIERWQLHLYIIEKVKIH